MILKKYIKLFISCITVAVASITWSEASQAANLEVVPTAWRLQDYTDGAITIWYTGSTCTQGQLILPNTVNNDSKDRLWSLILTAKAASKSVGVFYHYEPSVGCLIDSFYLV